MMKIKKRLFITLATVAMAVFASLLIGAWQTQQNFPGGSGNGHAVTNAVFCSAASGSSTAYTCSTTPSFTPGDGDLVDFDADVTNTGAITLAVNGAAAVAVKKWVGGASAPVALIAGDIQANQPTWVYFDAGLNIWSEMSPMANSTTGPTGTLVANDILTGNGTVGQVQDPGGCTLVTSTLTCASSTFQAIFGTGTGSTIVAGINPSATIDGVSSPIGLFNNLSLGAGFYLPNTNGGELFAWSPVNNTADRFIFTIDTNTVLSRTNTRLFRVRTAGTTKFDIDTSGNTTQTGSISPSQTGGIIGTTTNNSANAGSVGELISSQIVSGSAVSLTSGTAANVTSVSLTAGDWDCSGAIDFTFGATTSVTNLSGSFSQTSATMGPQDSGFDSAVAAMIPTAANPATFPMPVFQELLSATTTIFLVSKATFTVSTTSTFGTIRCRRVR